MSNKTVEETFNNVSDFLNSFGVSGKTEEFIKHMNKDHRTLQQNFTRFCLAWIENCASDEYRFDLRNKSSHEVSKTLIDKFKEESDGFNPSEFLSSI